MSEPNEFVTQQEKETGRIEAFSDGVFAIAITLLILEIKVPNAHDLGAGGLGAALLRLWPSYLAFVTSFATILVMWVNHHKLFRHIRRSDDAFLFLNGLLLLFVTSVPFPTSLVAEYLQRPEARAHQQRGRDSHRRAEARRPFQEGAEAEGNEQRLYAPVRRQPDD